MEKKAKRVLVIDDDPDFVLSTTAALKAAGYEVAECLEAAAALDAVHRVRPDLLILDVMMEHGAAGFQIAQQLRREPDFARLPILMVTAIHQTTKLHFSPDTDGDFLPVNEFLDKPVAPEKLVERVKALLAGT